jgi:hypothetical protein
MTPQHRKDLILGIVGGISLPFVIALIIFKASRPELTVDDFFTLLGDSDVMSPFIRMALLGNGILFWLFLRRNREMVCRGILLSTLVYGIYVIYMTFV